MAVWTNSQTQWRIGPRGHPCGLDYAAVAIVARACGTDLENPRVLRGIRILEECVLEKHGMAQGQM